MVVVNCRLDYKQFFTVILFISTVYCTDSTEDAVSYGSNTLWCVLG